MCFSKKYLEDVVSRGIVDLIGEFFPEAEKEAKANIVYPGNKNDILDLFKDIDIIDDTLPNNVSSSGVGMKMQMLPSLEGKEGDRIKKLINDMISGISAAIAVQKWMEDEHDVKNPVADKVYLTGDKWPKKVEPLKVSAHGFDAYNSCLLYTSDAADE